MNAGVNGAHPGTQVSPKTVVPLSAYMLAPDAELALIGGLLVEPSLLSRVTAIVGPSHVLDRESRLVFQTILAIDKTGGHVDKVSVTEELRHRGQLADIGGAEFLTELLNAVPTPAALEHYAHLVRAASDRRWLLSRLRLIAARVKAGEDLEPLVADLLTVPDELALTEGTPPDTAFLHCVAAANVAIRRTEWFMPGRIPLGEFVIFDGEGGLGKTTVALSMIAAATAGLPLPDGSIFNDRPSAIILAEEDSFSMLKSRLQIAGADMSHIQFVDYVEYLDGRSTSSFSLPANVPQLERLIRASGGQIVYLDSLFSHFDPTLDAHRSQDVRVAFRPLVEVAHATGVSIWGTRHWAKTAGTAASRGLGSADIRNVARAVLSFGKHPTRYDDEGVYVAAVSKSNYGPQMDALLYRIESVPFQDDEGKEFEGGVGRIVWLGSDLTTADDIAGPSEPKDEKSQRTEAREVIIEFLSTAAKSAKEMDECRQLHHVADRTFQRARRDLRKENVITRHGGGVAGPVYWSLVTTDRHDADASPCETSGDERNELGD